MSDLMKRNTEAVKAALSAAQSKAHELIALVESQNAKITALDAKVQKLEQQVILMSIKDRGSGPTAS